LITGAISAAVDSGNAAVQGAVSAFRAVLRGAVFKFSVKIFYKSDTNFLSNVESGSRRQASRARRPAR
jgi:hypothetical protein